MIADGNTFIWAARAFLNAFRSKLDTSPATVKVAVMAATYISPAGNGGGGGRGSATRETMSWGASPVVERCDCMPQPLAKVGTTIQP